MANKWLDHVMEVKKKHPEKKFSEILVMAKATYKK